MSGTNEETGRVLSFSMDMLNQLGLWEKRGGRRQHAAEGLEAADMHLLSSSWSTDVGPCGEPNDDVAVDGWGDPTQTIDALGWRYRTQGGLKAVDVQAVRPPEAIGANPYLGGAYGGGEFERLRAAQLQREVYAWAEAQTEGGNVPLGPDQPNLPVDVFSGAPVNSSSVPGLQRPFG